MKNTECGHDRNIALLDELLERVIGFGPSYNPGNNDLKVAGLQTMKTTLHTAALNVDNTRALMTDAVNDRQFIYEEIRKRATRIVGEAIACGADEKMKGDLRSILHKLRGARIKKIEETPVTPTDENTSETTKAPESDPAPKVRRSVSQQSYDLQVEHLRRLKALIEQIAGYVPNEIDLTIAAIGTLCTNAENATKVAHQTRSNYDNARFMRDKLLYRKVTGALYIAERVRNYVKAVYGGSSPQYVSVMRLHFRKFKYTGM
ncbi:MAG: hypothetical protein V2A54_16815 [Bacteroidota bacterium]